MKQGDIVALPYPFTDYSSVKKRPAIIVSNTSEKDNSIIVAKITSVIRNDRQSWAIEPSHFTKPLKYDSEIRLNEVATIDKVLVDRVISTMLDEHLQKFLDVFVEHNFSS